jgi:predicted site-specific integrase-resolvase
MTSPQDFMTTAEACAILGVHKWTLIRWIQAGDVTKSQKLAGQTSTWLHDRAEIEAIAAGKVRAS